ncbi:MAG: alginate export family protein [Myxococcales bacterium]|nr:alginate export family protein [Myxococcales bacterium]
MTELTPLSRLSTAALALTLLAALLAAPVHAQAKAPSAATPTKASADDFKFDVHGAYSIWGLNQHGFFLGKDVALNDADYVVQNLRLKAKIGSKSVGVKVRLDAAQGWWGVDNSPNVSTGVGVDADGNPTGAATYNPYKLFRSKDTNYGIHIDRAFLYFDAPWGLPLQIRAGRQLFAAGNKLVLDQAYEGLQLTLKPSSSITIDGWWAKVAEGRQSIKNPVGALMNDEDGFDDADLYGAQLHFKTKGHKITLFGLMYQDNIKDFTHLNGGLGYFHSRFQAEMSSAIVAGLNAKGKLSIGKGLLYNVEFDYLTGKDDNANTDFAGNNRDKNNGELAGFNAYAKLTQKLNAGVPMDVSLVAGMGSGDDDPTSGKGNINRIQTMGFFPLTNVWEDSVMPDVEGITPQGLGSPASRGYRELENTTVAQLKVGANVHKTLRLETSYTYLQATQPIYAWDAKGPDLNKSSTDIGQEVDFNFKWKIRKNLKLIGLYGVFLPGEGASYLITGTADNTDMAWEAKHVLVYNF